MQQKAASEAKNACGAIKRASTRPLLHAREQRSKNETAALFSLQRTQGNRSVQNLLRPSASRNQCSCGGTCSSCQSQERQRKQQLAQLRLRQSLQNMQSRNDAERARESVAERQPRFGADFSNIFAKAETVRTKKIAGVNVTKSDCGCLQEMKEQIDWSKSQAKRYSDCGKDPANKTGGDIRKCVAAQHAKEGITTSVAGTTSSTGVVTVNKRKGPCADILEKGTAIHEAVHAKHQNELEKKFGKGTPAFDAQWDDAKDWAQDEANSYLAEIPFYRAVAAHLASVCGSMNTTGAIIGGILGAAGGAVLGGVLGGVGGAIGLGFVGAGIGALAGGLIGNLFED